MVGTPAVNVTPSSTIRSASALGCIIGPGKTMAAPPAGPAWARPHALAWNIGTTGMTTSVSAIPNTLGCTTAMVCSTVERWL